MLSNEINKILQPIYKFRFLVLLLSGFSILVGLVPPFLMGVLIDDLAYFQGFSSYFIIGTIVAVLGFYFFLDWMQAYAWHVMTNKGAGFVRCYLFDNVLHKNYRFFMDHPIGDVNNKVINDSYIYAQTKIGMMPTLILNIMHIVVIFGFLAYIKIPMALATMAFSLVFYFLYLFINKNLQKISLKEREGFSSLMNKANETLMGINTIQLYTVEGYFSNRFEHSVEKYEKILIKLRLFQSLARSSTGVLISLMSVFAIFIGIIYVVIMDVSIGGVVSFYLFLPRLSGPIRNLTEFNVNLQSARAVEARLEELLTKEIKEDKNLDKIDIINQLEFKELGFTYPQGKQVMKDISFTLTRGDALAIVGPSGTGKTTFLRLLKRQVEPTQGEILINQVNCTKIHIGSYIDRIAVLTQEVFIFDGTLQDNISFGKKYPEKQIRDVAKLSVIDHFSLDESAFGLSGGERQRVGLARALACEYDVLILDEPTSDLDSETELKIIENLKEVLKDTNCMMIVVTHSDNVLEKLCNKRLYLH